MTTITPKIQQWLNTSIINDVGIDDETKEDILECCYETNRNDYTWGDHLIDLWKYNWNSEPEWEEFVFGYVNGEY